MAGPSAGPTVTGPGDAGHKPRRHYEASDSRTVIPRQYFPASGPGVKVARGAAAPLMIVIYLSPDLRFRLKSDSSDCQAHWKA